MNDATEMATAAPASCFISFLGTGKYKRCRYRMKDKAGQVVTYVQTALFEALSRELPGLPCLLFCTELAEETHAAGLREEFAGHGLPQPEVIRILDGKDEGELWENFNRIGDAIPRAAEVFFDVTHSFRSLPVLMTVLLGYLGVVKGVTLGGCYYGAFDSLGNTRDIDERIPDPADRIAPVFDLTPFFALNDWAHAIRDFDSFSDASTLVGLVGDDARFRESLIQGDGAMRALRSSIKTLDDFARDVRLGNARAIHELRFQTMLHAGLALPDDGGTAPRALSPVLEKARETFADYPDADLLNGFRAAKWAARHDLLPQGYTILQETLISFAAKRFGNMVPECYREGAPQRLRDYLSAVMKAGSNPQFDWEGWKEGPAEEARKLAETFPDWLLEDFGKIARRRNAFNHGGTSRDEPINPRSPDFSPEALEELADKMLRKFGGQG